MIKIISTLTLLSVISLHCTSLRDVVQKTLITNPNIIAEKKNQEAYRLYVDERKANYEPTLDFNTYFEKNRTIDKRDGISDSTIKKDGYVSSLSLKQNLYDGGLTPSEVEEMKHENLANKFRSLNSIENTILETINSYTSLVRLEEQLTLTSKMIEVNEENLQIAKEKEDISGEVLETYQVSSKLNFLSDKFFEEQNTKVEQKNKLKRYVGVDITSKTCRPVLDETIIPKNLDRLLKDIVLNNNEIKEQIERIKVKREKIAQSNSTFLPRISFELKTSLDHDIEFDDRGDQNMVFGRVNLDWNLYNGGKDKIKTKQEKLFLQEQKKTLDEITAKVVEEVKKDYFQFFNNKKRIEALKKYVEANVNIVEVYKNEFEAGTRTFVDILNAENELYQAHQSLIRREYALYNNYYSLLYKMGNLTNTLLKQENQDCSKVKPREFKVAPDEKKEEFSDELKDLLEEPESKMLLDEMKLENTKVATLNMNLKNVQEDKKSEKTQEKDLLDIPSNYFTINLATIKANKAKEYLKKQNLIDNSFFFDFGKNKENTKILYGAFQTTKEAKIALKNLNGEILKNKPYIDNIKKHQELYKKYN